MTSVNCSSLESISLYCLESSSLLKLRNNLAVYNEALIGGRQHDYSTSEWLSQLFSNNTLESHQEESQEEMENHGSVAELLVDILYANGVDCDLTNLSSISCVPVQ